MAAEITLWLELPQRGFKFHSEKNPNPRYQVSGENCPHCTKTPFLRYPQPFLHQSRQVPPHTMTPSLVEIPTPPTSNHSVNSATSSATKTRLADPPNPPQQQTGEVGYETDSSNFFQQGEALDAERARTYS
ncbi:unnamed protein product, partial [Mesocestoides corti]